MEEYDLESEAEDEEIIGELKKAVKTKNKFDIIINKKKLSKYELDDLMV